jgi:hypothetical protein
VTVVGQLDDELKFVTWFSDRARFAKDVDVGLDLGKTAVNSLKEFFENGKEKLPFAAWAAAELLGQAIGIVRALSGKRGRRPVNHRGLEGIPDTMVTENHFFYLGCTWLHLNLSGTKK